MSAPALFVADAHLSAEAPARTACFLDFLAGAGAGARALFLLGDIFDAWLGDDDESPFAVEVRAALRRLSDAGAPLFFQRGNHDFLLGRRFMRAVGGTPLPDEYVLEWGGERWLLAHGDIWSGDASYHFYRRFGWPLLSFTAAVSSRAFRRRLYALLFAGRAGGGGAAASPDEARITQSLARRGCVNALHGHEHKAGETRWTRGGKAYRRVCLPDWAGAPGYAVLDDSGLRLVSL